ncbi:MAG TPA: 3-oxoacyl-ACP synthase, partial [Patescibacteria group bacterium]|nr:3-oxoacyl-ACP synthase [Patescibacteria group bacterium]
MKLRSIAIALPHKQVDAQTIADWTSSDVAFIKDKIGIESRAFLSGEETQVSLAVAACENLFKENTELKRDAVQMLVVITQNPDFKLPHSSAIIQEKLGLLKNVAAFDVNLGCSGYVYGLSITKAMMALQGFSNAILITSDPYSTIMAQEDRDTVSIFGDAATATWLSVEKGAEIGIADMGTDGAGAENLMIKAGGSAHRVYDLWNNSPADFKNAEYRLTMNGRAIFNFMMERVPQTVDDCLQKNSLSKSDID